MGQEEMDAVSRVMGSNWFVNGKELPAFEKEFAEYTGTKFAVGCSNGSAAIELALRSLGIGKGDEVMVPSHTAFPTVEAILNAGAKPFFVDIDKDTYTMKCPERLPYAVRAVIGVHLYGHPFDVNKIREFCDEFGIYLIEDCAQAVGAEYKGKKVGSLGDMGCFSFYPSKNMTVAGDGGMITTNSQVVNDRLHLLRDHGNIDRDNNVLIGHNYRLGEIQSAVGREQLKKLDGFNDSRRWIATLYNDSLNGVKKPIEKRWAKHVYHLYVIRSDKRDSITEALLSIGVKPEIHYPIPTHRSLVINDNVKLPVTERIVEEILSLPIYPTLSDEDVLRIIKAVNNAV